MFFGYAFGGLTSSQSFEFGGFDEIRQQIARFEFFGTQRSESFDRLVLEHHRFAGMPLGHFLDGGKLFRELAALEFLVPGQGSASPLPTLGPGANGAGRADGRPGCGRGVTAALLMMIRPAGVVETATRAGVTVKAERQICLWRFARLLVPRISYRHALLQVSEL